MNIQYETSKALRDLTYKKEFKSTSAHGSAFLRQVIVPVTEMVGEMLTPPSGGRTPLYQVELKPLDKEVIALIMLSVCLDNLVEPMGRLSLAGRLSQYLEQEINYSTLESQAPGLVGRIHKYVRNHRARQRVNDAIKGGEFGDDIESSLTRWDQKTKAIVGMTLLEGLRSIGLIEVYTPPGKRTSKYRWSPQVSEWADETYQSMLFYSPAYLPLTSPPYGYTQGEEYSYGCNFPPVSFRIGTNHECEKEPRGLDNGVNAIAADKLAQVPYEINTSVLNVVRQLWDMNYKVGNLPHKDPKDLPPCPGKEDERAFKEWKSIASRTYIDNAHSYGRRVFTQRQLNIIDKFSGQRLYFIWCADSRGRLYPLASTLLNPQGPDLSRGLLKFHSSIAAPIGERGYYYLLCSLAEHYGVDKVSFTERILWAEENINMFTAIAEDPISHINQWESADSPFQFLAACFEYNDARLWSMSEGRDLTNYPSGYIKHFDGKCSGVQHWSALLRNKSTAASVGMCGGDPDSQPPDLYTDVLMELYDEVVNGDPLESDCVEMHEWWRARFIEGRMSRSAVKPPVMTYVYGSAPITWVRQVHMWAKDESLDSLIDDDFINPAKGEKISLYALCGYLVKLLSPVLKEVLSPVVVGMKWVQSAATAITAHGYTNIRWTTPGNFEVYQAYRKLEKSKLKITSKSMNKAVYVERHLAGAEVNKRKQSNALPPNYIHSMDSTHLSMAVKAACLPMTVIHDSFGSLLSDGDEMLRHIREQLLYLYKPDRLADLKNQWSALYPDVELPDLPIYGAWDPDQILRCVYDFS